MRTFWKRWRISIGSSFESLLTRVENHEAIVSEAIREAHTSVAKAKVKLAHIHRDNERLSQRISQLTKDIENWERRAQSTASMDRDRALECLRRRNQSRTEFDHLSEEYNRNVQTEKTLSADIMKMEEYVSTLRRRKNELCAKDYRNQAAHATATAEDGSLLGNIDDIFERWEMKLAENSSVSPSFTSDSFADDFTSQEEKAALESELDALLADLPSEQQ